MTPTLTNCSFLEDFQHQRSQNFQNFSQMALVTSHGHEA